MMEPQDPFTTYLETAAQIHEMFLSYVEVGFSREEAMQLIVTMLQATIRGHQ